MTHLEQPDNESRLRPVSPVEALDHASVRFGNRLLRLVSNSAPAPLDTLASAVDAILGTQHELFYHDLRIRQGESLPTETGMVFATEFWLPPDPEVGVMLIDMNVVEHWLETLLDDEPPRMRRLAPLGSREFGLATFVLLHVADALKGMGVPPVVLSSEPPPHTDVLEVVRDVERVAEVVFGTTSERSAGLVRLFVPEGLTQSFEAFASHRNDGAARLERLSTRYSDCRLSMTCRLGSTRLTPSEVDYLEAGDVVIPDDHGLDLDGVEMTGEAIVLVPRGASGAGWEGLIRPSDQGRWLIEIQRKSTAQKEDMSEDVNDEEQTEMIERANVDVEFKLGEISMPLGDLADLRPGFVLETERDVGDGVDLISSGRKIATGELVSIEGRLGIRIVSVER